MLLLLLLPLPKGVTITCPDHLSSSFFFVFAKMHLKKIATLKCPLVRGDALFSHRKRLSRLSLKGEK